MGLARRPLARVPRIGFWKLFGSGSGEGFTPLPNTSVYAILATWPDMAAAVAGLGRARVFQRYRFHASESWNLFLLPTSSRGTWSGVAPFEPELGKTGASIVALTRATVRPRALLRFWRRVPAISYRIGSDPRVAFKIGIGEVPWLHQVTFSIWPDAAAMSDFARADGPHARAIQAVRSGNWFREELYARFQIIADSGTWGGRSPIADLERPNL